MFSWIQTNVIRNLSLCFYCYSSTSSFTLAFYCDSREAFPFIFPQNHTQLKPSIFGLEAQVLCLLKHSHSYTWTNTHRTSFPPTDSEIKGNAAHIPPSHTLIFTNTHLFRPWLAIIQHFIEWRITELHSSLPACWLGTSLFI